MTPFLKQIAGLFYDRYGANIHRLAFVFPNRRSGLFFRKYLSETATEPIFSPAVLTINELFGKLNPKQQADPVKLLFLLYDIYCHHNPSPETFDDFAYWGKMLINDFDDIDKYLIDAKRLFSNITDLNTVEKDYSFLQPSQVQAIRSFWSSFRQENSDSNKRFFLHIWERLYPIYTEFRETLAAEGLAYEGMIYREVVENFEKNTSLPYEIFVFVGLNALTNAEKELLRLLNERYAADFYWDYSSEKVKDGINRASYFMNDNLDLFRSSFTLPEDEAVDTQIELVGVPSRIGQAKQLYPILESLSGNQPMTAEEMLRTAVVLPDEQLLLPVLHSIPAGIDRINVTLGYPLSGTPVASLMEHLQSLQRNLRKTGQEVLFYHSDVIAILQHAYVSSACPDEATAIIQDTNIRNQAFIPATAFDMNPFLQLLFAAPINAAELSDYLISILKELHANTTDIEQEFIFHYYTIVNRMRALILEMKTGMSSETYFRLLKQMTDFIRIPFQGEPLSGLQVMGVLETRVLDFDTVIILSVNEGIFPAKRVSGSFIPYHLRCGFGLPTPEHQDSIWAYHFYRLIHRAKRVILLYDTRADGLQSGEVSRFVHQLRYHYKTPVLQKLAIYNISSSRSEPFKVDKDEEIMRSLALYETEKSLSASAINTYLDCPLRFYFTTIKGIEAEKAVSETLRHDMFGTLLHRVMELAYKPLCGKTVTADLLKDIIQEKNMTALVQSAFAKDFFHADEPQALTGQSFLYGEMIRKYACKILAYDRMLTPFQYIGSEKLFHQTLEIKGGKRVRIKGFIDRIDRVKGKLRIVDYKSGKDSALTFTAMDRLFDGMEKERKKAIMQVFLYAWVYASSGEGEKQIQPAVYYVNNLFKQNSFDPVIYHSVEKENRAIDRFEDEYLLFEESLRTCLNNLFDPDIPFTQTPVAKQCDYCPFKTICR